LTITSGNNTAPSISCLGTGVAKILINEAKNLKITKSDSDGDTLTVKWFIDGDEVSGETSDEYNFSSADAGTYTVKSQIDDGTDTSSCSWEITVESQENSIGTDTSGIDVPSLIEEQTEEQKCGNGIIEEGEDCENCPEDVQCAENEVCDAGVCIPKKPSSTKIFLVLGAIILAIGAAGFAVYKVSSKKSERQLFSEPESLDKGDHKERPSVDVHDIYEKEKKKEPEAPKRPSDFKESPIQKYAKMMREKGFSEKDIAKRLKKQGWKDEDLEGVVE